MFGDVKPPHPNTDRAVSCVLEKLYNATCPIMDGDNEVFISLTDQERAVVIDALKHYHLAKGE